MARSSTTTPIVEQCWIVVGQRRGRIWFGRRVCQVSGMPASVCFDGQWALQREESHQDVLGFFHTHPAGFPSPSLRDVRTMRAWCSAFGKPLICLIECQNQLNGFRFDHDSKKVLRLEIVETFSRGNVIGVESHGEQVSS